ncbi:Chromobox protein [Dirofilaria immitis]
MEEMELVQFDSKSRIVGETYAVEKIVGIKMGKTGEKLYKVRWKGFSESEDTWEPYDNLTDGCDRLIIEYEVSQKSKNDEDEEHLQPSTSRSNATSEDGTERSSRHAHTTHWEYETVEVLTPDEWNRFGDVENRELGGLYIPDRIPTETEKLLCNLAPDVGRVTRNKLKIVMKTESSPVNETSSDCNKKQTARGRRRSGKKSGTNLDMKKSIDDGRRSVIKDESKTLTNGDKAKEGPEESSLLTFSEAAVATKPEIPDEILLSQCADNGLQIVAADTSTEDEEPPVNRSSTSFRSTNNKRAARGKGGNRGRGRRRKASTPLRSNEVLPTYADVSDEIPNLVVDEMEPTSDEERQSSVCKNTSRSHRGKPRGRGSMRGSKRKRTASHGATVANINEASDSNNRSTKSRKQKTSVNTNDAVEKRVPTNEGVSQQDIHSDADNTAQVLPANNESEEPEQDVSALEMLALETSELPIPLTNADIPAIEIATIRRHQQNREKPLQTFEQFRSAVLTNQLSAVRWTGRCVPERRGFDFNQKYRGKTVAIELCERPCGPAHEVDDMLRQIVRDGARLDIPDDTRGRIPLHFAISCEFWCRVKTLLHLRSPVNTEDKDKKTPLHLAILTPRAPNFEVTKTIYLLLEYGADVNELIKKVAPLRNRYLSNLIDHQQRLSEAFDEARMKTLVDITVKRILLPVSVRAMWEFESTDWTTEIGFNHETFMFPNDRYAYMILLAVFDYRSARYWRVRMWGESPFDDVKMNDAAVEPLTNNPKGFIYVTSLINGWNKLKIKFQPYIKKKKWLMMAQVLLIQLHKPASYVPRPALEVAPESGTDWRHE